ncbi:hypothetical protein [Paenochrobactrum glaciei]|uniref:SH3 domain-containing protein n=1 Tax=Paenochrobactrum glaciei TaxID=486407 RepID=A0ABP3QJR3_9HYPH
MATAKRKPRTTSRSTKRAPAKKGGGTSVASVLALGAIVVLGAVSLWAASQHKSPQTAISNLWNSASGNSRANIAPQKQASAPQIKEQKSQPARTNRTEEKASNRATATAPIPRPEIGLSPSRTAQAPQPAARPQTATTVTPANKPNQMVAAITPPASATKNLPPRGVNRADSTPTMVYAKQKLTVHKTAWDKSPSMGEVEKGRELRSYGQTGKWHRVVVPATDMIGWVHQDMLVIVKKVGNQNAQAPSPITTGSIKAETPAKPLPFAAKATSNHPVPKNNVGN